MSEQLEITHEELWDDSALIDSWNEALEEYKKYHSIHAKGGSIKDLESLKKASNNTTESEKEPQTLADRSEASEAAGRPAPELKTSLEQETTKATNSEGPGPAQHGSVPSFPVQTVLGSIKDENLKKLLMSWYYAGYYTGLFEGQQQVQQDRSS